MRDFMKDRDENLLWCHAIDYGNVQLVICGGTIVDVRVNNEEVYPDIIENGRAGYSDVLINRIARMINDDYDTYHGWTDIEVIILSDGVYLPCNKCPWFDVCEAMDDEMEEDQND